MKIVFSPKRHIYYLEGKRVPSCTEILMHGKKIDSQWFTAEGRERGTQVHQWIHHHLSEKEKYVHVAPENEGYLRAFMAFLKSGNVRVYHSEKLAGSVVHQFCCRVDIVAMFHNSSHLVVIDVKTGSSNGVAHQIAANRLALAESGIRTTDGHVLRLFPDGRYVLSDPLPWQKETFEFIEMCNSLWETDKWRTIAQQTSRKSLKKNGKNSRSK